MVEFQPPCVKNPPIDGWFRTSSCGAQLTNKPLCFCFLGKFRWENSSVTLHKVRPNCPHKGLFAISKTPSKLNKLLGCHNSNAPKININHRVGFLGSQPL
ncbi:hypothetical protein GBA52_026685 [Prunus armeniaca]|nr:hypothetical protein GBA52_026685 [Prunus armeniaca]